MNTVHYIKVHKVTDSQLESEISERLGLLFTEEDERSVAVEEIGDFEVIYTFLHPYKVEQMVSIFKSYSILVDEKDVTDSVLMACKNDEFESVLEHHQDVIEEFVKKNLTVDVVLDKINLFGVESLNDNDRQTLENV
jgi:hypothetical protein